ncbi:MAG: sulfatase-like hydrolase/transferase, partial [Halanaerobiales bacterium]
MKTIVILCDSLRRDYLECYPEVKLEGSLKKEVHTPNIKQFAEKAAVFDNAYINSHPTGPFRREAWTGKIEFPHRGWGPLLDSDKTFARLLGKEGVTSMLITDNYAITDASYGIQSEYTVANPGHTGNYQQWFTGWNLLRGHQSDRWWPSHRDVQLPCAPEKLRGGA